MAVQKAASVSSQRFTGFFHIRVCVCVLASVCMHTYKNVDIYVKGMYVCIIKKHHEIFSIQGKSEGLSLLSNTYILVKSSLKYTCWKTSPPCPSLQALPWQAVCSRIVWMDWLAELPKFPLPSSHSLRGWTDEPPKSKAVIKLSLQFSAQFCSGRARLDVNNEFYYLICNWHTSP